MSSTAIQVQNLSKKFTLKHEKRGKYTTLRDVITDSVKGIGRKKEYETREEFWALKDVCFDIKQGDRVGIIGRNGAGKSTLLKILSRITEPTSGRVGIKGRVASLLEVGTGFHPELTGKENIFLNGAILGMSRGEIKEKFDAIVAFAETEKFLDTPVKRYSSGMYVRLAFSIAAHLEPEILIVDEVLAVGDAQFQKKCLGKMEDISKGQGRTVVFVSHSMTSIQTLCSKGIYLDKGRTEGIEKTSSAVSKYLYGTDGSQYSAEYFGDNGIYNQDAKNNVKILSVQVLTSDRQLSTKFKTSEPIVVRIVWKNIAGVPCSPNIQLKMANTTTTALIASDSKADWSGERKREKGTYASEFIIPGHWLNANDFFLSAALDSHSPRVNYEYHLDIIKIAIWDPMDETSLARGMFTSVREDVVLWPALDCSFEKISEL